MATKQASVEAGYFNYLLFLFDFPPIGLSWFVI